MASKLFVDVYTVPAFATATGDPDPLKQLWSPTNITLIHNTKTAVLCDCPPTIIETEKLASWIQTTFPGLKITYFFLTHAHLDHFFGLPALSKHFPGIKAVATKQVTEGAAEQYANPAAEKFWPGQLPTEQVIFEALPESNEFEPFDGVTMKAYDVVHGDCAHNSYLHVPALELVVAGDVVYGDCHQYLVEASTKEKRGQWLAALDGVEALRPQIVVPEHARASQVWGAYLIESTRKYIHAFTEELAKADSVGELVARMQELYSERWNLFLLEVACAASFANKGK
ncbi:hypothetical protein LTS10_001410 [Elasticomyces elasticus]|nr:hypothetical protein LTS10_001410 [Elasticomyces elasticus]